MTHRTGEIVEIVGINSNTNGHSCEEHDTCGCVLAEDTSRLNLKFKRKYFIPQNKFSVQFQIYRL